MDLTSLPPPAINAGRRRRGETRLSWQMAFQGKIYGGLALARRRSPSIVTFVTFELAMTSII